MVFLTRGRAERITREEIGAWLASHPAGIVTVDLRATGGVGLPAGLKQVGEADGYNYSNGREVRVGVFVWEESK